MSIGLFGTFYPQFQWAANSTLGIARVLSTLPQVERIRVFCPVGSTLPHDLLSRKVSLIPCWRIDSASSLLRVIPAVRAHSSQLDLVILNIYLTSFGRSRITNGVGFLVATFMPILTGLPVLVYLHNLLESQDVPRLGHRAGASTRRVTGVLERALMDTTVVVVPLPSQSRVVQSKLHRTVQSLFLPGLESFGDPIWQGLNWQADRGNPQLRVLLFGNWGPQKDLLTPLRALRALIKEGKHLQVTVAGPVSGVFPDYAKEFEAIQTAFSSEFIRFIGSVSNESVPGLLEHSDVLILPYNATGGYSGAMNLCARSGISIISYDHEQLRESADLLDLAPTFVRVGDFLDLKNAIDRLTIDLDDIRLSRPKRVRNLDHMLMSRVADLITTFAGDSHSAHAREREKLSFEAPQAIGGREEATYPYT